ncbi:MAG: FAD-dependent monooxygenase [Ignavibacteria bacterium]|nr:FAD-dependent monooxygenase [Ignavibacteria bacterium]MCC7157904.1 FAD-dependent monooxygenase [Ignavibacteria bacterium]
MEKITIVGAGLAGSLLSVYLAKKGYEVEIYERRPDMRKTGVSGGKSINLALSTRGIHALKEVGLYEEIKKIAIPMYGRMVHSINGNTQLHPYGKDETEYINSVSRAELNKKLMDLAEDFPGVRFHFDMRCLGMDPGRNEIFFHDETSRANIAVKSNVTIATDGATSPIRMEMLKSPRFDFSQEYENYGYKELNIPPFPDGTFKMESNALHIWPRGSFMLIALPNMDGSFTCTLFIAYDRNLGGDSSFEHLINEKRVIGFFQKHFRDAYELMPTLIEDFFENPTGSLITVKCFPWSIDGKLAMLGDSCHAIVPFFGQGMNAAFEDCTYMNECIDSYRGDWNRIFLEYQQMRKVNTDAIADLAQENFIEMRDLVSDPKFLLKKKIEGELYKMFPDVFIPKYTMVTFLRIPYSVALSRGKAQESILSEISSGITGINSVDWGKAKLLVKTRLSRLDL